MKANTDLIVKNILFFIFLFLLAFTTADNKSQYNVPIAAISITSTDLDLDGDNDIVIGHLYSTTTNWGGISTLNNNTSGIFQADSTYLYDNHWNIFAAKINDNDYFDIITQGTFDENIAVVLWYDYDQASNNIQYLFLDYYPDKISYGDIDDDSNSDIVFCNNFEKIWGVLYNNGNGNFSNPQYFSISDYNPINIACADLNGDERDDIVISSAMKTEIFFSLENGFQSLSFNTASGDIYAVDFDNDGDPDIVSAYQPLSNFTRITLFENLGNENFTVLPFFDFQPKCSEMTFSDFDNDSLPDLLLHTQDVQNLLILYNNGNFELSEPQIIPLTNYGESKRRSACADFDGNGYNDIATIRSWGAPLLANVNIFFNDGNGNFIEDPITQTTTRTELPTSGLTCYPNPFQAAINITYQLKESAFVDISVFNLNGELIKVLTHHKQKGGQQSLKWNGLANDAKPCKPGPYLLTFKVNEIICNSTKIMKY